MEENEKYPVAGKKVETNFIEDFAATELLECIKANVESKSNKENHYHIYRTKNGRVSIMKGWLEELHKTESILRKPGTAQKIGVLKDGAKFEVDTKIKIGRKGRKLYVVNK